VHVHVVIQRLISKRIVLPLGRLLLYRNFVFNNNNNNNNNDDDDGDDDDNNNNYLIRKL